MKQHWYRTDYINTNTNSKKNLVHLFEINKKKAGLLLYSLQSVENNTTVDADIANIIILHLMVM